MRRKDREITSLEEIIKVIKACKVCHVAFFDEKYPYVVPMNFGMEVNGSEIFLYFHGANEGKKHELIRKNNKVAFAMEDTQGIVTGSQVGACECTMEFESVMGTGIIDYIEDNTEKTKALHILMAQYDVYEGAEYHFHNEVVPKTAVLRLRVNNLTGKRRIVG